MSSQFPTQKEIEQILDAIPDPEIGISIFQMGLIYGINCDAAKGEIIITMTLTSIGCPLFDQIAGPIREEIEKLPGVNRVSVDLTFDPPWSVDRMSDEAKASLGLL